MDEAVRAFLEAHPSHCEVREDWPLEPEVPLLARLCLATSLPPAECRSSVLGIVTRANATVFFLNPENPTRSIVHVLVGGRAQPGETPEETLRREIGEETGWRIDPRGVIGFRHFRHLGPPHQQMADRPYPEFIQPIYAATGQEFDPSLLLPGEIPGDFVDARWALELTERPQRPLLHAALRATGL